LGFKIYSGKKKGGLWTGKAKRFYWNQGVMETFFNGFQGKVLQDFERNLIGGVPPGKGVS